LGCVGGGGGGSSAFLRLSSIVTRSPPLTAPFPSFWAISPTALPPSLPALPHRAPSLTFPRRSPGARRADDARGGGAVLGLQQGRGVPGHGRAVRHSQGGCYFATHNTLSHSRPPPTPTPTRHQLTARFQSPPFPARAPHKSSSSSVTHTHAPAHYHYHAPQSDRLPLFHPVPRIHTAPLPIHVGVEAVHGPVRETHRPRAPPGEPFLPPLSNLYLAPYLALICNASPPRTPRVSRE